MLLYKAGRLAYLTRRDAPPYHTWLRIFVPTIYTLCAYMQRELFKSLLIFPRFPFYLIHFPRSDGAYARGVHQHTVLFSLICHAFLYDPYNNTYICSFNIENITLIIIIIYVNFKFIQRARKKGYKRKVSV